MGKTPKWWFLGSQKGSKRGQKGVILDPFLDPLCSILKGKNGLFGPKRGSKKGSKKGPKMTQNGHFWPPLGPRSGGPFCRCSNWVSARVPLVTGLSDLDHFWTPFWTLFWPHFGLDHGEYTPKVEKWWFQRGSKNPLFLTFSKNDIFGVWGVPRPLLDPFLTPFWPPLTPWYPFLIGIYWVIWPMSQTQWFQVLIQGGQNGPLFGTPKITHFGSTKGNTREEWKIVISEGVQEGVPKWVKNHHF